MLNILKKLFETGVDESQHYTLQRSITLSNYVAFILWAVNNLLLILIPQIDSFSAVVEMLIGFSIFLIPFVLNKFKYHTLSSIYLSWAPILLVTFYMITEAQSMAEVPASLYNGMRYYLLACGCIPFLLFGKKNPVSLVIAVLPSFLIIVFCDPIFSLFNVGYDQVGIPDEQYKFTQIRAFISYLAISGSCLALKLLVDNNDEFNEKLLNQLEQKNEQLEVKARSDLEIVNKELTKKLEELSEREFLLKESQRIAKTGNWEYSIKNKHHFWSDEMYNIFGLDHNTPVKDLEINKLLVDNDAEVFKAAMLKLLKTNKPFDLTVRALTPLGYTKWIRTYTYPIKVKGTTIGMRGICHDITYYKESELLLQNREQKYRTLFERAFDPVLLTDLEGNITDVNTSFCSLLDYKKEFLINKNITKFIDKENLSDYPWDLSKEQQGEHVRTERILAKRNGDKVEVEVNAKKSMDDRIMVIIRDVTHIRQAYRKLEEIAERFRTAFEHSAIGMALVNLDGKFTKVNKQLCTITGYDEPELISKTFKDITYSDDLQDDLNSFHDTLSGKQATYHKEKRYVHKNGTLIWVNISVSLVRDTHNTPLYFVTQIENITDRKMAEAELQEAETRFRTLVEKSLVGVYIWKNDRFDYVNPALAKTLQYSQDELLEMDSIDAIVVPEDRELLQSKIRESLNEEKESHRYELRGLRKDGGVIWAEIYGSRIPYQGQDAIIGTIIDITERKQYEKEQALLSSIISSSDDAIISISDDGSINSWNPGATAMFRYDFEEVKGKTLDFLVHDDQDSTLPDIISRKESITQHITKLRRKDGEIVDTSLTISLLKNDTNEKVGLSIIARDVTYRVRVEKAIRESEERYRTLVDKAIEALVVINLDTGKFTNVSESAIELFKYSKEQLLELGPVEISPEFQPNGGSSKKLAEEKIRLALKDGKASFEWTHCDAEGKNIPCEIRLVKLPSENPTLIRGSIIDISDRIAREMELAEAHKKIGDLKLMALRSVMSPHFIFNVLTSIQYYIAKNDRLNAINYLSTFSKLMRNILNHSVNNSIKVSEEIAVLRHYIELELTRFEHKFDYDIIIDDNIDADAIEIPSLLLQPYVENAIIHGLYNKSSHGKLLIHIYEKDETIFFRIEDNGIGRAEAMKLKRKSYPEHKSMGVKLTEERLRLINEKNQNISFKIEDLQSNGKPSGTRVEIGIMAAIVEE